MGYKIVAFQNTSQNSNNEPTIKITNKNPKWIQIYKTWLAGNPPTNSPEWKKGIIAITEPLS